MASRFAVPEAVKDLAGRVRGAEVTGRVVKAVGTVDGIRRRFGTVAALEHASYRALNVVVLFEWLDIIVLDRERLWGARPENECAPQHTHGDSCRPGRHGSGPAAWDWAQQGQ